MSEEYAFSPEEEVLIAELTEILRAVKEEVKPYNKGSLTLPGHIPPYIQEVVTRIYDVHGGIDILMRVANVSYQTIKRWHREWRNDASFFMSASSCMKKPGRPVVLGSTSMHTMHTARIDEHITFNMNPRKRGRRSNLEIAMESMDDIKRNMPLDAQNSCANVKKLMVANRSKTGNAIDGVVRQEVCRLVDQVGSIRPVALLTGLNDRVIKAWCKYHSQSTC
mmetsp:Transcript_1585/g.3372  ORF Transcript_1585/g.3372 Transcript_1585/m.3372 type:complete len:222 (+) Transcript_1585:1671-2336(+)